MSTDASGTLDDLFATASEEAETFEKLDFNEYVDEAVENPEVARSASQRLYDMFQDYSAEFNDDEGRMEYAIVKEDPENDGQEILYGDSTFDAVDDVVKRVENAAKNMASHKRLTLMLGPVGSGKTAFSKKMEDYFETYTRQEEGKMYTFDWDNLYENEIDLDQDEAEVLGFDFDERNGVAKAHPIHDQDPRDNSKRAPMNQEPLLLLPEDKRADLVDQMNENLDAPYTVRLDRDLTPESQFYVDELTEFYMETGERELASELLKVDGMGVESVLEELADRGSDDFVDRDTLEELSNLVDNEYGDLDEFEDAYEPRFATDRDGARMQMFDNHVDVRRFVADKGRKQAIANHEPKEEKAQDESDLTGSINMSKITTYGENDPRAFDYSGALNVANRGLFSGEEFLKNKEDLLFTFLEATENGTIDPKNQPLIDVDTFIIGRTNMAEFIEKKENDKMKAFNSRTNKVDFKYLDEYEDEAKIYEQFVDNSDYDVHVEPHTIEMASLFAVASRLEPVNAVGGSGVADNLVQKAKIYNGDEERSDKDWEKILEQTEESSHVSEHGEGMDGITPRYIEDQIAEVLVSNEHEGKASLSGPRLFSALEENMDTNGSLPDDRFDEFELLIDKVEQEYKSAVTDDVRRALTHDLNELESQGEKYFNHVMAYVQGDTVKDEIANKDIEPNERFMQEVEQHMDVREEDKRDEFRRSLAAWVGGRANEGESYDPLDNDEVREALKQRAWHKQKDDINFSALVGEKRLDDDQRETTLDALTDMGYSEGGAEEALGLAATEIAASEEGE